MALGIVTAAGSGGQVVGPPIAEALLGVMPWQQVMLVFAAAIVAVLVLLPMIRGRARRRRERPATSRWARSSAARCATRASSLIFLGFFSCGYQLGFLTAHFPAFVAEVCSPVPAGGMLACARHHHHLGARRRRLRADRPLQHRRHARRRRARPALPEEEPAGADLRRPHHRRRRLHPRADDAGQRDPLLGADGLALARDGAADLGPRRLDLGRALHGHALRHRLLLAPARRLPRRLARRPALRHLPAPTRWSGGSASGSAPSRRSSTCRSASARRRSPPDQLGRLRRRQVVEGGVVERVEPRVEPAAGDELAVVAGLDHLRRSCSTMIRSAPRIVASRCAMTSPVRPSSSRSSAFWISISV